MSSQVVPITKASVTARTGVAVDASVDVEMALEASLCSEAFVAVWTLVWTLVLQDQKHAQKSNFISSVMRVQVSKFAPQIDHAVHASWNYKLTKYIPAFSCMQQCLKLQNSISKHSIKRKNKCTADPLS